MLEILHSGELGGITKMEAWFCFPLMPPNSVRWNYQLAGGPLMDAGCYKGAWAPAAKPSP
jgi:hypothetical protein